MVNKHHWGNRERKSTKQTNKKYVVQDFEKINCCANQDALNVTKQKPRASDQNHASFLVGAAAKNKNYQGRLCPRKPKQLDGSCAMWAACGTGDT